MRIRERLVAASLACICTCVLLAEPEPVPKETTGSITGEIIKKDGSKITIKGKDQELTLMPYWRGGMPKDGGGLDQDMVKRLKEFKVGDVVEVKWTFEEHYRIDSIERQQEKKNSP